MVCGIELDDEDASMPCCSRRALGATGNKAILALIVYKGVSLFSPKHQSHMFLSLLDAIQHVYISSPCEAVSTAVMFSFQLLSFLTNGHTPSKERNVALQIACYQVALVGRYCGHLIDVYLRQLLNGSLILWDQSAVHLLHGFRAANETAREQWWQ